MVYVSSCVHGVCVYEDPCVKAATGTHAAPKHCTITNEKQGRAVQHNYKTRNSAI